MSVGERLRQARLQRHLGLDDVFAATRIRRPYLQALEAEDWDAFPSRMHARAFLRTYAEFLGLAAEDLLSALQGELGEVTHPPQVLPQPPIPPPSPPAANQPDDKTLPAREETPPVEAEPLPQADTSDWQRLFVEIGEQLRARRELLGLSLAEVAAHTRVPEIHLQALEAGRFISDTLMPVQARGFLQQYASFIELDVDDILLRFAEGLQRWRLSRAADQTAPVTRRRWVPEPMRRWFAPDLLLVAGIALAVGALLLWWGKALQAQAVTAAPTLPSISDVLLQETPLPTTAASAEPTTTPAAETAGPAAVVPVVAPTLTPTPLVFPTTNAQSVQLTIAVSRRVWLRVLVDGEEVLRERAAPGAAYTFGAAERIEVQTADASAVQLIYNGRDLGVLGAPNRILYLVFSPDAMMTPTATVSPTPTITATPTRTLVPTQTPVPSATPTP